jgi:hypothetical protein
VRIGLLLVFIHINATPLDSWPGSGKVCSNAKFRKTQKFALVVTLHSYSLLNRKHFRVLMQIASRPLSPLSNRGVNTFVQLAFPRFIEHLCWCDWVPKFDSITIWNAKFDKHRDSEAEPRSKSMGFILTIAAPWLCHEVMTPSYVHPGVQLICHEPWSGAFKIHRSTDLSVWALRRWSFNKQVCCVQRLSTHYQETKYVHCTHGLAFANCSFVNRCPSGTSFQQNVDFESSSASSMRRKQSYCSIVCWYNILRETVSHSK